MESFPSPSSFFPPQNQIPLVPPPLQPPVQPPRQNHNSSIHHAGLGSSSQQQQQQYPYPPPPLAPMPPSSVNSQPPPPSMYYLSSQYSQLNDPHSVPPLPLTPPSIPPPSSPPTNSFMPSLPPPLDPPTFPPPPPLSFSSVRPPNQAKESGPIDNHRAHNTEDPRDANGGSWRESGHSKHGLPPTQKGSAVPMPLANASRLPNGLARKVEDEERRFRNELPDPTTQAKLLSLNNTYKEQCHDVEHRPEERDRHPSNGRDKDTLYLVEVNDVPSDTKDRDEILDCEFFDTRQAFLSLSQGNHYQYDTLRRTKHSSMIVLYHLHNPTAPAFVTTCRTCHNDIESGQGWRCEICPDYYVCSTCYNNEVVNHPHKLTTHPSIAARDAWNKEAQQKRVVQLGKMLALLVHASQCHYPQCMYPNCRKVKGLFRHGIQCKVRASRGCVLCKKMWYILQLHARACRESQCHVPRCKDLKEHLRRLQQQSGLGGGLH